MPPTTRQSTPTDTSKSERNVTADDVAGAAKATTKATTKETATTTAAAGSGAANALGTIITAPVTVARAVADDVVATVRRPDAMLYVGGLVGLAALGVLEWPLVAVAGVGLAVANGMRRAQA